MVDALIRAGADVKASNRYGVRPLSLAAENGNTAILGRLLDAGSDPNTTMPEGETVLMTAARGGNADAVKLLLVRHADVSSCLDRDGDSPPSAGVPELPPPPQRRGQLLENPHWRAG